MHSKLARYLHLVAERKACRDCASVLTNPAVIEGGTLDSAHIGPYTLWQGNLNSPVVVIGQDFSDTEYFVAHGGRPGTGCGTSRTLVSLAREAALPITVPAGEAEDRLFFTNAVLCLKQGGMQAPIPAACWRACATRFLRETIEIVQPRAVVTLGRVALDAALHAFGMKREGKFFDLVRAGKTFDLGQARLLPMCHPSRTVPNVTRSLDEQRSDWRRLLIWLETNPDAKDDAA